MRINGTTLAAATLLVGGASLVAASPAAADPNVPCWSRSTYISGFNYYNLTYKNCGGSTVSVKPYDEFYGCVDPRKTVAPGTWVQWTHLQAPAWHGDWVADFC